MRPGVALLFASLVLAGCGGRTGLNPFVDADVLDRPEPGEEVCSGVDEDLDGRVDEGFRDEAGRYVHPDHCGGCGLPCAPSGRALEAECAVVEESALCVATRCEEGLAPSPTGRCVPIFDRLCLACTDDGDCGDLAIAACDEVGGERRCVVTCAFGCPDGYACMEDRCIPAGGSCACEPGQTFDLACALDDGMLARCPGRARCEDGVLSACGAFEEVCNASDDDCDGTVDEGFVDARGAYSVDIRNCGECGVDCTESTIPEGDLVCGGDPFAPTCVLACPDAADGIMPGDRIDADRDIATGCECTVSALSDAPGPVGAVGEDLDVNCDGADGIVLESFYVAPDGNDAGPGSPTRPLRTIQAAIDRAAESLETDAPRPHVFVASGAYAESLELRDGVKLHGGYRRDYLALEPTGFRVEVRAPSDAPSPGGAALTAEGVGGTDTVVEWITLQGRDARMPSAAAFGAVLVDPGPRLRMSELELRAGVPGNGMNGVDGEPGAEPEAAAPGEPPRGAVEDAANACIRGPENVVAGGEGGRNSCEGVDVSGGRGGAPTCPTFANRQPSGEPGRGSGAGGGGAGGQDSQGPITGSSCTRPVCCGLADFSVPTEFTGPQSGTAGADGRPGGAGAGCRDAFGRFVGGDWVPASASGGSAGRPGSGGGGGGAGGGAEMRWFDGVCEFADGLGGGGGGGGAGGCGGAAGSPGSSGGPSVALVVRYTDDGPVRPFVLRDATLRAEDGGRGGDGGAGGDGGRGGAGGLGGELPREDRSIPTLAGPFPGGRGGRGGTGGPGGGGGGGCGGASVGLWVTGNGLVDVGGWESENTFGVGIGGLAGQGGGGGAAAEDGEAGGAVDVLVR